VTVAPNIPGPLYERVRQYVMERVRSGAWPEGHRLPSEREFQLSLRVSRVTVHRALRELSASGYVKSIHGVGRFVSKPPQQLPLLEIRDIAKYLREHGHVHTLRVVQLEALEADPDLAAQLAVTPRTRLFHSVLVHFADGVPIQLEERFVSPAFAPDYLEQDFNCRTPAHYLTGIAAATEVEHTVSAVSANARAARLLSIARGTPCLQLGRTTWVGPLTTTWNLFTHPGSRYHLRSRYPLAPLQSANNGF